MQCRGSLWFEWGLVPFSTSLSPVHRESQSPASNSYPISTENCYAYRLEVGKWVSLSIRLMSHNPNISYRRGTIGLSSAMSILAVPCGSVDGPPFLLITFSLRIPISYQPFPSHSSIWMISWCGARTADSSGPSSGSRTCGPASTATARFWWA